MTVDKDRIPREDAEALKRFVTERKNNELRELLRRLSEASQPEARQIVLRQLGDFFDKISGKEVVKRLDQDLLVEAVRKVVSVAPGADPLP